MYFGHIHLHNTTSLRSSCLWVLPTLWLLFFCLFKSSMIVLPIWPCMYALTLVYGCSSRPNPQWTLILPPPARIICQKFLVCGQDFVFITLSVLWYSLAWFWQALYMWSLLLVHICTCSSSVRSQSFSLSLSPTSSHVCVCWSVCMSHLLPKLFWCCQ